MGQVLHGAVQAMVQCGEDRGWGWKQGAGHPGVAQKASLTKACVS